MPAYHVAQMNWGRLLGEVDNPRVAPFVNALDTVNGIADRAKGFVWRLTDADMTTPENAPAQVLDADPRVVATLSVWETPAALSAFVHDTLHGKFLARRDEWFAKIDEPTYVIWPIRAGHRPTLAEGKARLSELATNGASDAAYDFKYLSHMSSGTEAV
ncbi:DUF3291 domain-containing protein [Pseudoruegeria sp. SHC-113]|uniref:DUF3291 domain-containing protein n=1 Tax=Pseudoruegeria sp. SHC-113 TaxID=2855439 RepID=UPI0021BBAACF|nr:DUF3291 domain-containing protein [Pseudoruegeria sp. SHC-113]MCT8161164.1 DUF3291 domain-containing protein [Pseudoruegeria sp. SHC-113]